MYAILIYTVYGLQVDLDEAAFYYLFRSYLSKS